MNTNIHIINHTHWDREWFLTSVYTSRWIPGLVDKLIQRASENPDYRYLFDGQTLIIEDLLKLNPGYEKRITELIQQGHLSIGPYYSQPDWQQTSGELLIRNLQYGQKDLRAFQGHMETGWLVDTFGHISQAPQIHRLFGIGAVFVWRGVPVLEPYFHWQAPDGSQLLTINLFGGYRNLYGVSHTPDVAVKRLDVEIEKLSPYYPTADIPLFDGYDLEDNPEDPLRFFAQAGGTRPEIHLQESTPEAFARLIQDKNLPLPTIQGELNSGKYGATFTGVFSARTYLKVMAHDCEHLLFGVCEPLAALARLHGRPYPAGQYEAWGRLLLQNAVHDCICGVSIDQVHEKMEFHYRQVFDGITTDLQASLGTLLEDFEAGNYAVSTNPQPIDAWQTVEHEYIHIQTQGIGVWPVQERLPITQCNTPAAGFHWENSFYQAAVDADGTVRIGEMVLGELDVFAEHGDTYSEEKGGPLGRVQPTSPVVVVEKSDQHCVLRFNSRWQRDDPGRYVTAITEIQFDQSPLVRWQVDLNSRGTDFRVEMAFAGAIQGKVTAGMPFDAVERPLQDTDLLPRDLPADLARVLLGQRELNAVTTFPMHDFVTTADDQAALSVLSKGIRAYSADAAGTARLPLRRSTAWLTKADLKDRIGDAGPFFYVPDAMCERRVRHAAAALVGLPPGDAAAFQHWLAAYHNPPLVVGNQAHGTRTHWQFLQEDLPLSSLQIMEGAAVARFYNPTAESRPLSRTYTQSSPTGRTAGTVSMIAPKQILTVQLPDPLPEPQREEPAARRPVVIRTPFTWRIGDNSGRPDLAHIAQLEEKIQALGAQLAALEGQLAAAAGTEQLRLQHQYYVLKREQVEFQLSAALNRRKLAEGGTPSDAYLFQPDEEITALGYELNQLRIKRRIFDYVIQVL